MLGQCDLDLMSMASTMGDNVTISGLQLTARQQGPVTELLPGDALYFLAHGNGKEWGSHSKVGLAIKQEEVVGFLAQLVPNGVNVYLCVCSSIEGGRSLKRQRPDLTVWAADGEPKLSWNAGSNTVDDSTGRFQECE